MKAAALLELRRLGKCFGGVVANADISLCVSEGAIAGLIGPNGSGKTTLFNVVTGLCAPDSGEVLLDGRSLVGLDPGEIARSGLVRTFQQPAVYEKMTCRQCLLVSISHAKAGLSALFSRPSRSENARARAGAVVIHRSGGASRTVGWRVVIRPTKTAGTCHGAHEPAPDAAAGRA